MGKSPFTFESVMLELFYFRPYSSKLYYIYFKEIPSSFGLKPINTGKLRAWMEAENKEFILNKHSREFQDLDSKFQIHDYSIYILKDKVIISIEEEEAEIVYAEDHKAKAEAWLQKLKRFQHKPEKKRTSQISLITTIRSEIKTIDLKLKKPDLDIEKHYNDDLKDAHDVILESLNKKDKSGLILLHGIPGTGKSTYIRYLIHCQRKKVIFLPARIAGNIDSPEFTRFLMENRNTVLVIEDAESLIVSREMGRNSGISMLLNITDGLLGESLGIQVIATFNTPLSNIDGALLRRGRMICLYEFKALSIEKTKRLLEKSGRTTGEIKQPLTLAEIYNYRENNYSKETIYRKPIGFGGSKN